MGEETMGRIVASLGSGDLNVDEFMQAVQDQVDILYPVEDKVAANTS